MVQDDKRYERLIHARDFHYEQFNKWLTFFYVAVGAIFAGYYSEGIRNVPHGKIVLNVLGLITSLMLYWSGKGYYYWITNWIMLIHDYERRFLAEDRVYGCHANKSANNEYFSITTGANISTSKVSLVFSFMLATVWMFLLIKRIFEVCFSMTALCYQLIFIVLSVLLVMIAGIIPKIFLRSNLENIVDLKLP